VPGGEHGLGAGMDGGGTEYVGVWSQESIAIAAPMEVHSSLLETMLEVALVQPDNNAHKDCANLTVQYTK